MSDYISHHGVKGQKWGVRRYQNKDGSLNAAGKKRYADESKPVVRESDVKRAKAQMKSARKTYNKAFNEADSRSLAAFSPIKKHRIANEKRWEKAAEAGDAYTKAMKHYKMMKKSYRQAVKDEAKKILAGESFVGKVYDLYSGAHKIQAEIKINSK